MDICGWLCHLLDRCIELFEGSDRPARSQGAIDGPDEPLLLWYVCILDFIVNKLRREDVRVVARYAVSVYAIFIVRLKSTLVHVSTLFTKNLYLSTQLVQVAQGA